jgi:hypothetical protein
MWDTFVYSFTGGLGLRFFFSPLFLYSLSLLSAAFHIARRMSVQCLDLGFSVGALACEKQGWLHGYNHVLFLIMTLCLWLGIGLMLGWIKIGRVMLSRVISCTFHRSRD